MPLDRETLDFLKKELPKAAEQDLERAFERVFSDQFGTGFVGSKEGKKEENQIHLAVSALKRVADRIEALPLGVKTRLLAEHKADIERIDDVLRFLEIEYELSRKYHELRSERGGRNQFAHDIAEAVHLALSDLGITPTFGTRGDDSAAPSTVYGRIVQRGLRYHRIKGDWRRPAEQVFRTYGRSALR